MKLAKTYEPSQYEPAAYALWESSGAFHPSGKGEPYSIVMPPPNANGNLHIGHALTFNLQDILIRYNRMKGKDTVYIPGADHAGFETWVVYEKELLKQGKSRFDFSREELYQQVWDFVASKRGTMELELRALGVGADWDEMVFTLDDKVIKTVYATFKQMWDDGLIYRGERIVNYCTFHQTSFADIEVEHREEDGSLWYISYPLTDKVGEITIATTRPETLLGDTAIAVHPDDPRYKDLIGKHVRVPIVNREVPIVGDEAVDPKFGTGAVKVTPAHDPLDFEIGQRHRLPVIQVINNDGTITPEAAPEYAGLTVESARQRIVAQLRAEERLTKTEPYRHSVGHCYKCDTVIEPMLMELWFVKVEPLAAKAIEAIKAKEIVFTPASKAKELIAYLEQLRDWNISRQPAWGIPIPAFQNIDDHNDWIFDERVEQPTIEVGGKTYRREEDTFDTWFSSGQWPYIVTDALNEGDLSRFYPTNMMETGHDLLRPWVARMIMFGVYRTGKIPFKTVYMHGMVLDEHGKKMSKSKGNVINPMEIIGEYGSDALRLGIVAARTAGQNQAFSRDKVVAGRNFANKLWNMARFIEGQIEADTNRMPKPQTPADNWVTRQLDTARQQIEDYLDTYRFAEAADMLYHTVWDDVADWYLEASKDSPNPSMLAWVLETSLTLAHPFAPFVTETIWSTLAWEKQPLILQAWPKKLPYDEIAAGEFDQVRALVSEARFVTAELPGGKQTLLYEHDSLIADNESLIIRLAHLKTVEHVDQPSGLRLAVPNREAWIKVDEKTLYEHQNKLEMRIAESRELVLKLEARLGNANYVAQAPAKVVDETRAQLAEQQELLSRLGHELEVL